MKIKIQFKWYDLWIGFFWDKENKVLYFCPLPTIVLRFNFHRCYICNEIKDDIIERRQNSAYDDDSKNFITVCKDCFDNIVQPDWEERWKELYGHYISEATESNKDLDLL